MHLAMVDHFNPGQQGLVEFTQGDEVGLLHFGQEIGADKAEEALHLALSFGIVRAGQDAFNAHCGAGGIELMGAVDRALVNVNSQRRAVAQNAAPKAVFQTRQLLIPVELSVRNEAGVVVNEGKEEGLPFLVEVGRIGQIGAVQGVALPKVAKSAALKTAVGFGRLGEGQQRGGRASFCQLTAQGAFRQLPFGDGIFRIQFQDADDGAGGDSQT